MRRTDGLALLALALFFALAPADRAHSAAEALVYFYGGVYGTYLVLLPVAWLWDHLQDRRERRCPPAAWRAPLRQARDPQAETLQEALRNLRAQTEQIMELRRGSVLPPRE